MRRTRALPLLLLVALTYPLAARAIAAPPDSGPGTALPPGVRRLAPGVLFVPGQFVAGQQPDGNSLIFESGDGVILFDTGRHVEHAEKLLAAAATTGLPPKAIVNSHWHLDHVGGNLLIRDRYPRVVVYASGAIHQALRGFLADYRAKLVQHLAIEADPAEVRGRRAEIALIDGGKRLTPDREVTTSGPHKLDGLELHLETFAVTAGDIWALDRRTGILAAGDLVTLPIPLLDTACPEGWEKALDHLAATPFEQLVPGHGEPMNQLGLAAYRDAFHALRACAASHRDKDACVDGWLRDAGPLVPPGDVDLARQSLGYYVAAVLRGDPVKRAKLCGPGA